MKFQAIIFVAALQVTGLLGDLFCKNIHFMVKESADGSKFESTQYNNKTLLEKCPNTGNLSIILHGWTPGELLSPLTWVDPLHAAYYTARGGCVIYMDYTYFSNLPFLTDYNDLLVPMYENIKGVLVEKLQFFEALGYDPANIAMWGFSFGGQLVLGAGYTFGSRKIGRVDACDAAGEGFAATAPSNVNAKDAAINVQCVHTSFFYGTSSRTCQKNVNMGTSCGISQPGQPAVLGVLLPLPFSHNRCPYFFISAFTNVFEFVAKGGLCTATHPSGAQSVPTPNSRMGFYIDFGLPDGEYYSASAQNPPYNVP